jgi:hypothetical protein
MVLPDRSKTRQSHRLPRFVTKNSNIRSWYETNQKGSTDGGFLWRAGSLLRSLTVEGWGAAASNQKAAIPNRAVRMAGTCGVGQSPSDCEVDRISFVPQPNSIIKLDAGAVG